jgi:hypothetical protein
MSPTDARSIEIRSHSVSLSLAMSLGGEGPS